MQLKKSTLFSPPTDWNDSTTAQRTTEERNDWHVMFIPNLAVKTQQVKKKLKKWVCVVYGNPKEDYDSEV